MPMPAINIGALLSSGSTMLLALTEHMMVSPGLRDFMYDVHCPYRTSPFEGTSQSTATTHSSISSGCMRGEEAME